MKTLLTKVLGDPGKKAVKQLERRVAEINELEPALQKLTDQQLKAKTAEFKQRHEDGESLDKLLPEAFAVVREASVRVLGMRHFDVQLIGGMALHENSVAEMKTGEGKTLVATLPLYLNALTGRGVHLVTVNDYLAQLHAGWMGQLYDFLGLSTGVIMADQTLVYDRDYDNSEHADPRFKHLKPVERRREGYAADITYGTNNEFGFDYLRDNMVRETEQLRQRELYFAIVDEVDSILIDEARTPLIISAPAAQSGSSYALFASIAKRLKPEHYELDEKRKTVSLNDEGVQKVQDWLDVENLYAPENVRLIYHMDQALRAQTLFHRDKDYIVNPDGEVIIVDEFTGRLMHGRRYNEGLHQAIEAKEGVEVLQESMTLATISFQNYFRLYEKLAGMTGTAKTEEEEFYQIYKLSVVEIPPNKPSQRVDRTDRIYKSASGKFQAIVKDVAELHKKGQPVLIGTSSIEKNELVSRLLTKAGVPHTVLNAKHHEQEAAIIAKAGQKGAVTLATNIAGRGTDIVLGDGVVELGGLFVIGSERHESRRIDNQLRGRSGRQGDPGMTQFYVSAQDDLMRIFGGDRIAGIMNRLGVDDETPIENRALSKAIESAQKKVESLNFDSRKHVVEYDDVMNRHRKAIYAARRKILLSEDVSETIQELIEEQVKAFVPVPGEDSKELSEEVANLFNLDDAAAKKLKRAKEEQFTDELAKLVKARYAEREKDFTPDMTRKIEREVYLQVLDNLWMQHLENMDHLREGINWQSVGQRDPLVEYRRQGQRLYEELQAQLRADTVRGLFHVARVEEEELDEPVETELTKAAAHSVEAGASEEAPKRRAATKKSDQAERPVKDLTDRERLHQKHKQEKAKKKKQQRKNRKRR